MKRKRSNYKESRKKSFNKQDKFYTKEDIFISRMASILMFSKSQIIPTFSQRATTTIRINPLKSPTSDTVRRLTRKGFDLEKVKGIDNVYFVLNKDKSEISQTEEYYDGKFYIQNLSSILPSVLLDPKENERVLDMCAAPGSKTTHLAALMNNEGEIVANDSEISRVSSLKNVLEQFGVKNTKVLLNDANNFGKKYPNTFDKVLLDAPCSGEGLIYFRGPKPLRFWSIEKVKRYSFLQKELLESAFLTLKHGKFMIYSTCTLEPEENEGTLTYLLEKYPNARIEKIELERTNNMVPGIIKWSGNKYHPMVKNSIRILPTSKMMGFFIAKIFKE
jgi:16S rRNA (cytosine1407-C5)-methyltransferase